MPSKHKHAGCKCLSTEEIEETIAVKMNEQFEERFNKLKDSVVTLMAEKLSSLSEDNCTLKCTLANEVVDLRNWQKDINKKMEEVTHSESDKNKMTVMQELVNTFNGKLTQIEDKSKQSIQEVHEDIQSIRDNICEMLNEVPQVTMSSLETRFCQIEEKLDASPETVRPKNINSNLIDVHVPYNSSSLSVTKMSSESIESHDEFLIEVANEVDERQKRKKTLVIHNIEETDNAAEERIQVTNILNEIIGNKNLVQQQQTNLYRLGKRSPAKKRTIKVHFKSEEFCRNILHHTRKLRETNHYKHIVLQPDLTPVQRHHLKMLVEEKRQRNSYAAQCKEEPDWIIYKGKLCRRRDLTIP